jgi:hypothetical protein
MNRTLIIAALAATAITACSKSDHTIVAGSKDDGVTVNTAAIVMPPAIESTKSYRCKDNTVVYIDWLNDKKTADIRASKAGSASRVVSAEAGKPMTAAGYSLTGTKDSASVTVERPGKGSQSCKA